MSGARPYKSARREDQAKRTRELIVEALVEQVYDSGRSDFSIAEIAERAGVAERTVYRHFPTRADLVAAVEEHISARPQPAPPTCVEELAGHYGTLFRWFEDNERLIEVSHLTSLGREVHKRSRARRWERSRSFVGEALPDLTEAERRRALAVFRTMFGSATWRGMKELGLSSDESAEAVEWVVSLVIKDLKRRQRAAEKKKGG